jgi:membrane-bound metal-dependent hydrolase YbcI (DUF457 family)
LNEIAKTATITLMPSPIGHALAGLATGWVSQAIAARRRQYDLRSHDDVGLLVACVIAAVAADVDILFDSHRTYTHSVGAVIIVGAVVWGMTRLKAHSGGRTGKEGLRPLLVAVTIATAYGTHVLLDLLGQDATPPRGLTALWPFSSRFYISGADLFMQISRRYWKPDEFIVGNLKAAGWELIALGPVAFLAWFLARTQRKG